MALILTILATAIAFGAFAFAGTLMARTYFAGQPLPNGPPVATPPVKALIIAAATLGAICAYRGVPTQASAIIAVLCAVMAAIWATDVARGFVPDSLTLIPLGALVVAGLLAGHWWVAFAAGATALPFAFIAWRTKGIGLGWGDVKLAALGGAVLGVQDATIAFTLVLIVAIVMTKLRRTDKAPIAFAPYLASAIVIPLCLHTTVI